MDYPIRMSVVDEKVALKSTIINMDTADTNGSFLSHAVEQYRF